MKDHQRLSLGKLAAGQDPSSGEYWNHPRLDRMPPRCAFLRFPLLLPVIIRWLWTVGVYLVLPHKEILASD